MVTVQPQCSIAVEKGEEAGGNPPCLVAPSFLAPPRCNIPDKIIIEGLSLGPVDLEWNAEHYEYMSEWATNLLGYKIVISIHSDDQGNALVIDSHDAHHALAIGPRLELLHKYYGVGKWLLGLLVQSPLKIWTPQVIEGFSDWMAEEEKKDEGMDMSKMYPDWAMNAEFDQHNVPDLPPNLSAIVNECLEVLAMDKVYSSGEWPESAENFPFIVCTWYDNRPDYNRKTKKLNPYVESFGERGSSRAWMILDQIADHALQAGNHMIVCKPFHREEKLREFIMDSLPFIKLITYLSHDKREDSFTLRF